MATVKHKWKELPLTEKDTNIAKKWECQRGDCHCIRTEHVYYGQHSYMYERDGQCYSLSPDCHGDVPLNQQGIDD